MLAALNLMHHKIINLVSDASSSSMECQFFPFIFKGPMSPHIWGVTYLTHTKLSKKKIVN